jgi:hypothetical protein
MNPPQFPCRAEPAVALLDRFAAATGLSGGAGPKRYLWTDAFAVMTWVGLYETTGERRFLDLALTLVRQVHEVLAVNAADPEHPTARGVRIGKPLPERSPDEPYDPELEWERDGQYFHYVTKWMHALQRTASATGDERYRRWAAELARVAHRAFTHPGGMYWKMSVDLSRPLVRAMGAHDPLDGLIEAASLGLEREAEEFSRLCAGRDWTTNDPLGAGGLLVAALRLSCLGLQPLFTQVVRDAVSSVGATAPTLGGPASRRLAFRELGFSLGLHAVALLKEHAEWQRLERFLPVAGELEDFWLDPRHQSVETWTAHEHINAVTLAASLAPRGALG